MVPLGAREGQPRRPRSRASAARRAIRAAAAAWLALGLAPSSSARQAPGSVVVDGRARAIARGWLFVTGEDRSAQDWEALLVDADDRLALALRRAIPLPTTPAELRGLRDELGRSPLHDALAIERIAAAPRGEPGAPDSDRDGLLRELAAAARAGRFGETTACALASARGATGGFRELADLHADSLRPEPDLAAFSRMAFDRIVARELLRGRASAVAEAGLALAERHRDLPQLRLDAASIRLLSGDFGRADDLFAAVAAAEADAHATAALERRATAEIGRAWCALVRERPDAAMAALARAGAAPRPLLEQEDPLHVVRLRARLVGAIGSALAGRPDDGELRSALEQTPVDVQRCFVDEAWFGALGPAQLTQVLRGTGRVEALLRTQIALCDAVESAHAARGSGHGLLTEPGPDDDVDSERLASWSFLGAAERILMDRGDPAAALAFLAPRLARLAKLHLWDNQELLAEARLLEARCNVYGGDVDAAQRALASAFEIATRLETSAGREFVHRIVRDESPPRPPSARIILRADPPYASLTARVRVARANFEATLRGDALAAAEDLLAAGAQWPWDEERWLKCALDLARRGRGEEARRCLACVEASSDHAYDRACVLGLLGDRKEAVELLHEHLAWSVRTDAGRALEIGFMARDRDLAPLRDEPEFPKK